MTALNGFTRAQRHRGLSAIVIGMILALIALFLAVQNRASASIAGALPNSTFESGDGDLTVEAAGATDWVTAPNLSIGCDLPDSGCFTAQNQAVPTSDNSFGQGSKESIADPSPVTGSIPPNKSDLTRFLASHETVTSGDILTYVAWERANVLGNANMDFEFNQSSVLDTNGVTPVRTAGDVLITYDFPGSGQPALGLDRWVTSTTVPAVPGFATNNCQISDAGAKTGFSSSSNTFPCWGDGEALGSNVANGAVNGGTVSDTLLASDPQTLAAGEFGEAGIDLSAAGVFTPGTCLNLGSAYLKSRSASSFSSEMKDFVAPVPVNINNCGSLSVSKYIDVNANGHFDAGTDTPGSGWNFTVAGPSPSTTVVCSGTTNTQGNLVCSSGSLTGLAPGTYTVTETQKTGFVNTDPGPFNNVVTTTVVPRGGAGSVAMGNACYVAKTFQVTGVPSNETGLFAYYVITAGLGASPVTQTVALTSNGSGTWSSAPVNNAFLANSVITWGFGLPVNGANQTAQAQAGEIIGHGDTCVATNSVQFAPVTINGLKYKDGDHNGIQNGTEPGLAGFTFQLNQGSTQIATSTVSASNGSFSFSNIGAGVYTVHEVARGGWTQTQPATGDVTVQVNLNGSVAVSNDGTATGSTVVFGNTPLSNLTVGVTGLTGSTTATINCGALGTSGAATGSPTFGANGLQTGTYTCSVNIVDP